MTKIKSLLIAIFLAMPLTSSAQGDILINEENFPDDNFRNWLLKQDYGKDGVLTEAEIKGIASISVSFSNISSLKGIEHFTALTVLSCSSNQLTALDVSKNTALTQLFCWDNQLTALDVSNNTALTSLNCDGNQLTALDVSNNTALTDLQCYNNQLTALDVSKNTALTDLSCGSNQLTALDVSGCTALIWLFCYSNQLTALDVSGCTALKELYCSSNQLTTLDVSNNTALTSLNCSRNKIKGAAMDALISSLPQNMTSAPYSFYVYDNTESDEGNVCTKSQVAAVKAKGWTPRYYNGTEWTEYEGSDDESDNDIAIDEMHFPDANFRNYLLSQSYGKDGVLTETEIKGIASINVSGKNISSLKGLEYFTALTDLRCFDNQLTTLDVSKNTALTYLDCGNNQLTALDVSKNTVLKELRCDNNQLTSLDVLRNTALTSLSCSINQLTALDVSKNTALTWLDCGNNQLTALDVSKNTALTYLNCQSNQLTALDVSKNTALTYLYCGGNQLTALDVSKNTALTSLSCSSNQLTALDVSKNTALTYLDCSSNQLTALDVSKNTALTYLYCYINPLTALDVSKNTALTLLDCSSNQLTALDVSKNTALTRLDCSSNQLTTLDVSKNTALRYLYCQSNQLTALDVSKNTALTYLVCCNNVIRGTAMDNLISSLPQNTTNAPHDFYVYNNTESDEGNVCTKSQVTAVKAKGWTPLYHNGTEWLEYEGSDDEPTEPISITLPEMETVDVNSTIQLTPTIEPAGVETELTWSSDDESIAKVTSKGLVAGIKPGTAIISVRTSNNLIAECFVIVQDVSGIEDVNAGDGSNKTVYTISGQKVTKPVKGGIYIINGKKVVMK